MFRSVHVKSPLDRIWAALRSLVPLICQLEKNSKLSERGLPESSNCGCRLVCWSPSCPHFHLRWRSCRKRGRKVGPWERTALPPAIELPLSLAITLWLECAGSPDRKVLMDLTRADGRLAVVGVRSIDQFATWRVRVRGSGLRLNTDSACTGCCCENHDRSAWF